MRTLEMHGAVAVGEISKQAYLRREETDATVAEKFDVALYVRSILDCSATPGGFGGSQQIIRAGHPGLSWISEIHRLGHSIAVADGQVCSTAALIAAVSRAISSTAVSCMASDTIRTLVVSSRTAE